MGNALRRAFAVPLPLTVGLSNRLRHAFVVVPRVFFPFGLAGQPVRCAFVPLPGCCLDKVVRAKASRPPAKFLPGTCMRFRDSKVHKYRERFGGDHRHAREPRGLHLSKYPTHSFGETPCSGVVGWNCMSECPLLCRAVVKSRPKGWNDDKEIQ